MTTDPSTSDRPIRPYVRLPADVKPWDPRALVVAARVIDLIQERRPDLVVEHIGSTAVPGLPGKGIVDLAIAVEPEAVPGVTAVLTELGFGPQPGPDPWPPTRPMLVGSLVVDEATVRIHCHVLPEPTELARDVGFRDALRADPELVRQYADLKMGIVGGGVVEGHQYTYQKQAWIAEVQESRGLFRVPISPPATIGLLGGGQLGRMLALAARSMGYRIVVLDPDPTCPAAAVADRMVVGGYGDVGAALRLAELCDVVTYELEHVAIEVVDAIDDHVPVRPGRIPLTVTQDRLAERRFVEASGSDVAPWREVNTPGQLADAAEVLGYPLRLKSATGGYDGRGQLRLVGPDDLEGAIETLTARQGGAAPHAPGPAPTRLLAEAELSFQVELSVIVARTIVGRMRTFPISQNVHDRGILTESVAPAPVPAEVAARAAVIGQELATAMGLEGTLTVELFLMPDGRLVVNELAPRVHNSGHWTLNGASTTQFEQHIRAICGLELGATDSFTSVAVVNLLGTGPEREARLEPATVGRALADPAVHLHVYDKRRVFQRRKMGHLAAVAGTTGQALDLARAARDQLRWLGDEEVGR